MYKNTITKAIPAEPAITFLASYKSAVVSPPAMFKRCSSASSQCYCTSALIVSYTGLQYPKIE